MMPAAILTTELRDVAKEASQLEAQGAEILTAPELARDPLLQLAIAAGETQASQLMTWISVAFARSPMTLALQAHELNAYSGGRFMLGIGSQIKPHIEKRFSMPWSKPAARMREYVMALKAIWACWYEGEPLDFRGEFYTHTLMTPMFTPEVKKFGAPPVFAAAVGPLMTECVAEVADGLLIHSFTTEEYIRNVTLPAIDTGLAKSGRDHSQFQIAAAPFIVTGDTEEEYEAVKAATCHQIAFYGSTPAYRAILESVGYEDLQPELHRLSKAGEWAEMGRRIDQTLLEKIALVGEPDTVTAKLKQRYGDVFDICSASIFSGEGYTEGGYNRTVGHAIKSINS